MKACWCYTFVWNVATIWFPHWFTPGSLDNHNTVLVNLTSALYCDLLSCLARTRHYDQIWSRLFESSARIFLFWHCLWMPPLYPSRDIAGWLDFDRFLCMRWLYAVMHQKQAWSLCQLIGCWYIIWCWALNFLVLSNVIVSHVPIFSNKLW